MGRGVARTGGRRPGEETEGGLDGRPPLFDLGRIVATPGALEVLARAGEDTLALLARHRRVAGLDPVGRPRADSAALAGFRRHRSPEVLHLSSMASLSGASVLLKLAALAGPTAARAIPATGAAVLMLVAMGLFAGALAAAGADRRHRISLVRRRGAAAILLGDLVAPGPGPDLVPPIMLGTAAFFRWFQSLCGAPPLTAGSWAFLVLALVWLAARSVIVWRHERTRGAARRLR